MVRLRKAERRGDTNRATVTPAALSRCRFGCPHVKTDAIKQQPNPDTGAGTLYQMVCDVVTEHVAQGLQGLRVIPPISIDARSRGFMQPWPGDGGPGVAETAEVMTRLHVAGRPDRVGFSQA